MPHTLMTAMRNVSCVCHVDVQCRNTTARRTKDAELLNPARTAAFLYASHTASTPPRSWNQPLQQAELSIRCIEDSSTQFLETPTTSLKRFLPVLDEGLQGLQGAWDICLNHCMTTAPARGLHAVWPHSLVQGIDFCAQVHAVKLCCVVLSKDVACTHRR